MPDEFDLSELRQRILDKRPLFHAYFAWTMAGVLVAGAFAASGLIHVIAPDPGHHALLIFASFAVIVTIVGSFFFNYGPMRLRVVSVVVDADKARFKLVDGAWEAVLWPKPEENRDAKEARMRITEFTEPPSNEETFSIVFRAPGSRARLAPLPKAAFDAILQSWRSYGCFIREVRQPPAEGYRSAAVYSI